MSYLTLTEAKAYCRIEVTDDDELIAQLIDAAEGHVENFLNRSLSTLAISDNSPPDLDAQLPAAVKVAILMHIVDWYENREIVITGTIVANNPTAERILYPYRTGLGV